MDLVYLPINPIHLVLAHINFHVGDFFGGFHQPKHHNDARYKDHEKQNALAYQPYAIFFGDGVK